MTERIVLIFAYHYPPENAIGGARPFRFAKYLARLGYTCRVFTAAEQRDPDSTVHFVADPFLALPRNNTRWQLERAMRWVLLPGEQGLLWSCRAAAAARGWIRNHPAAQITIFSTFPPIAAHLAAWQLARRNQLAWIADCRDPLADTFADQCHTLAQRQLYRWVERIVAQGAHAVIANTDTAQAVWRKRFPSVQDKSHVIWNGFDPEDRVLPLPLQSQNCRTLSHIGELYHGRDANPVLQSVARLITAQRLAPGSVRIRLIGPAQPACLPPREFIYRAMSEGWLELVPNLVPQQQARLIAQNSNALLLLQSRSTDQVPAKLFEYVQIGRPILAFVQPNSPSERIIERSGVPYRCVYPSAAPETVDRIVAGFFDLPSVPVAASDWFEDQFDARRQTMLLDAIIGSIHNERPHPDLARAGRAHQPSAHPVVTQPGIRLP